MKRLIITQGMPKFSIILRATVVLPDADPPAMPII